MDGDPQARLTKNWKEEVMASPRYEEHKEMNECLRRRLGHGMRI